MMSFFAQQVGQLATAISNYQPPSNIKGGVAKMHATAAENRRDIFLALAEIGRPVATTELANHLGSSLEHARKWAARMAQAGEILRVGEPGKYKYKLKERT